MDNLELINFKDKLRNKLMDIYKTNGYSVAVKSIETLIKSSNKKSKEIEQPELAVQIKGECSEVLLEIEIREFAKKKKLNWIISKGLVIPRDNKGKFTELDLTLITGNRIILFESKFRSGTFVILEECNLVVSKGRGYSSNIYKQNLLHLEHLRNVLKTAYIGESLSSSKPFSLALYLHGTNAVKDMREEKYRKMIPCLSGNISDYLEYIAKLDASSKPNWDVNKVFKLLQVLDSQGKENMLKHLNNLRGGDK